MPSSRLFLARFRNIFAAMLLGIVLVGGLVLVSSKQSSTESEGPGPSKKTSERAQQPRSDNPGEALFPRLVFSTEQLPGKADATTAGSLAFDVTGGGKPALLVWSSAGILLYANGATPLAISRLQSFRDVRDVAAADFNNDGLVDLCVVTAHGVSLIVNKNSKGDFGNFGGATYFKGRYVQALWLDYDHDGYLDLILLGARPMLLRNQAEAGFVPQPRAIPFVSGTAIAGVVTRQVSGTGAFDFLVSYRDRAGVLYKDLLDGRFEAQNLPELPAGATHLRAGNFTGHGIQDFAYLLDGNATLVENDGSSWKARKTVPAGRGFLFADFANLGVQDWMANGLLLAGDHADFSQSRETPTASVKTALVAADFNLDGKLDFAGVTDDGSILRYLNQTDTENRWLRISLRSVDASKTVQGTVVEVEAGGLSQKFVYDTGPILIGMHSFLKADAIRLTWPDGLVQNETNQETDRAYSFKEAQ